MFHVKHSQGDVIAAIATPRGAGGIGVIRLSGPNPLDIIAKIVKSDIPSLNYQSHQIYHGWVVEPASSLAVDEVLIAYMKAPRSYTGEDVVEISGHGGPAVLDKILDLAVCGGARLAGKGEFTLRAYLNGKVDLPKAEAILDIIGARSGAGLNQSAQQLAGGLSLQIRVLKDGLLSLLAGMEAGLDYPEESAGIGIGIEASLAETGRILGAIERLLNGYESGRIAREGVRAAILGRPNVGKSCLLNALLGAERAIVADFPGTTRDTIEEVININGIAFNLIDTAGLRAPTGTIESLGIERALLERERADIALIVLDASEELSPEDEAVIAGADKAKALFILNKIDLGETISLNGQLGGGRAFRVSALTGQGLSDLKMGLFDFALKGHQLSDQHEPSINSRHRQCLERARAGLTGAIGLLQRREESVMVCGELKSALAALGEMTGEAASDEIIASIFDRFCVGK